ncbi:MAG: hypothetical protein GY730_06655 [bacterium]|nr:hypothetical protein [bacterium]
MSEDIQAFIQEQKELYESLQQQVTKQKQKLEHQEKQYKKQHSELTELKQHHHELKITFDDEIKIREAITIHIDHYVDEIQSKIRVMEQKVEQATEKVEQATEKVNQANEKVNLLTSQEVELLLNLSSEFRQGAYDIVKNNKK